MFHQGESGGWSGEMDNLLKNIQKWGREGREGNIAVNNSVHLRGSLPDLGS